jgi:hypothetical protein
MYNYHTFASRPGSPDDDMPLSQRKAIIRQSSFASSTSLGTKHLGITASPNFPADALAFDSHQPQRYSTVLTPTAREVKLANFRHSVQADLRAGSPMLPSSGRQTPFANVFGASSTSLPAGQFAPGGLNRQSEVQRNIDIQRAFLLNQKQAEGQRREKERWEREQGDYAFQEQMRANVELHDTHRDLLRRMQSGARDAS